MSSRLVFSVNLLQRDGCRFAQPDGSSSSSAASHSFIENSRSSPDSSMSIRCSGDGTHQDSLPWVQATRVVDKAARCWLARRPRMR
jgi:hypothetical protein